MPRVPVPVPVLVLVLVLVAACTPPGWGKPLPDAASPDGTSSIADAAIDGAATCDHAFRLEGHAGSSSVWLTGDFISWAGNPASGAIQLALGGDGAWTGSYSFTAGPHQYKFIVDTNQWITDPTNPDQVDDGLGGKNSLYTCTP